MLPSIKKLGAIALFGGALAVVTMAHAQTTNTVTRTTTNTFGANSAIRVGPGVLINDQRYNPIANNPYNPSTGPYSTCYGYCPGGSYSGCYGSGYGYGGSGYYSGGYCQDPYNGYLTGAASVISSQGQFLMNKRQAEMYSEQAKQLAVDTRRKIYEEWKYEKNDQPTLEQIRRDQWKQAYEHSIFHPPLNDIWSADALNRILDHAARIQNRGIAGSLIDLDEATVNKINFSTGVAGNIGVLKNQGKLAWTSILNRKTYEEERLKFNQLAADAVRQGGTNNVVDAGVQEDMERNLNLLDDKLTSRIREYSPDDYISAKHYIDDLRSALRILKREDVAKHINDDFRVTAKTIGELIKNMSKAGVRFAKARDGEEWAYNALYRALVSYDLGLGEKAGDGGNK
jgi:hypothetical protein